MKNYKIKFAFFFTIIILFLVVANFSQAGLLDSGVTTEIKNQAGAKGLAGQAGFNISATVGEVMANVIKGFLALIGITFIILIILAGHKWMIAEGNEDKVKEAKDAIRRAIIGLIIVVAAYSITYFVFSYLPWGTGGGGLGTSP